ncbi:hypothetical protein [Kribbella sp. HUAS MG21]|uniref:Uncharacterized protein n=1 Tax=Kribbella sp. HUAS MG21 TaxID=3160966 RepID=A0AAU7TKG8_9ACTN
MPFPLNDLGNAVRAQIYQTVVGGDETVKPSQNTFFTWVTPGLPFTPNELDFAADGIFSAPDAETQNKRVLHAYNLSTLLDFIPDVEGPYSVERQEAMYKPDAEKRLSEIYRQILRFSKVAHFELTDAEKAKLEKFNNLLWEKKTVKDLVTDEEKEVTEASAMMRAYSEKMAAYLDAAAEYNSKRAAAAGATGPEGKQASADWILNQKNYALKVKAAMDAWTSGGYRNEVDKINAYISQTTERSLVLWKESLKERYEQALIATPEVGVSFPYTTLVPGDIANSNGWTEIGVTHNHTEWSKDQTNTSWNAGVGVGWGFFNFNAGVSKQNTEYTENHQVNEFSLRFELAQAVIVRAGFYPEFFANRGWILRKGEGWTFDDMPSDGGRPPKGEFVGYATQAIFARNLEVKSRDFVSAYKATTSKVEGSGGVGWGPFRLSGGYSRSNSHEDFNSTEDGETLRVPGMQIIGFVNHLIGKAPNPLEELKDADFE